MGPVWNPSQHDIAGLHRHGYGGGTIQEIPGEKNGLARAKHAWTVK